MRPRASRPSRLQVPLRALATLLFSALLMTLGGSAAARDTSDTRAPGGQSRPLLFGMSTALSGPAADLGLNMQAGIEAAFERANQSGGLHGRRFTLKALDDGYEPARTVPNMHALLEQGVLGIVGNVGTPTAIAAVPIVLAGKTPFFGAYTGAGVLRRTPPDRYIINYRASYGEETAAMVNALVEHAGLRPEEIAFFTQRDGYGDAGFSGGVEALRRHGLTDATSITHARYERNTSAVEDGLADILFAPVQPSAVIMVGSYKPCAAFIDLARGAGVEATFLNVSFVGATPLARTLGEGGEGVIITQVVPHFSSGHGLVREYRSDMALTHGEFEPSFGSLEGYIVGRILHHALDSSGQPVRGRESIIEALEGLGEFDVGLGAPLELTPARHQASSTVWPTIIRAGQVVPFTWSELEQ